MSDSFNIGNFDPSRIGLGGETGDILPQELAQQAALARLGEGGGDLSTPPPPPSLGADGLDDVSDLSNPAASAASGLLSAWGSPAESGDSGLVGGFQLQSGPPPGFQSGGVFGPGGFSGQEPGMQSGAVYCTPAQQSWA